MSLWFYGYYNIRYLPLILISIAVNYGCYVLLKRCAGKKTRKAVLAGGILFDLGSLFYYKYYDFFFSNINAVFGTDFAMRSLVLPLAISFFTFQQLSFIIDAYRNETGEYGLLDYAVFVSFFPQLIAGPIVTHDELIPQLKDNARKAVNWDNLSAGIYAFTLGLAKKVLLADTFGLAANAGFSAVDGLDTVGAAVAAISYTFQIYFDFSGYCDMSAGIAKMMNFELPQNFNSPYKAVTITEFWDRWHMTLTRFFTKYVYIPLGGNRKGRFRGYVNTMIVFLVSGLWHGADWTFVLWGGLHGLFVVITKCFSRFFSRIPKPVNWSITFAFVNVGWIFFRADSIHDAVTVIRRILNFRIGNFKTEIPGVFYRGAIRFVCENVLHIGIFADRTYLFMPLVFIMALMIVLCAKNVTEKAKTVKKDVRRAVFTAVLLAWSILSLGGVSTFLYFNF